MSRLIFEGDTTKRFGEKFPRPFIEQIRIIDFPTNLFEIDIAFYFKAPYSQEDVDSFLEDLKNESVFSQSIVINSVNKEQFTLLKNNKNFQTLVPSFEFDTFRTSMPNSQIISFSNFISSANIKNDFYNLEGERFIKIYGTLKISNDFNEETYVVCFVKNGLDRTYYYGQTSDLVFEKVLDMDGSVTSDRIISFLEQNGNFYYQTPLMSLSRTYHKTDDYGHTELIKQFTDVLQNYSIDESDDILTTLDTQKDNPRLLIILKNKIDGFTDKSPATTMGRLYSQMASNIVLADTLISRQERLSKRQFVNTKISERRTISLPVNEIRETYSDYYTFASAGSYSFLPTPLMSRNLFPFYNPPMETTVSLSESPEGISKYFKLQTNAYYFFDYEKALNYKSNISKFINPYNIEQLFGKGSLANYFKFTSCVVEKSPTRLDREPDTSRTKLYSLIYTYPEESGFSPNFALTQIDKDPDVNYHRLEGSQGEIQNPYRTSHTSIVFSPSNKEELYSTLMQRGFDTHNGLGDYRLSLFELKDYQAAGIKEEYWTEFDLYDITLSFEATIRDTTMEFYDVFIRQKIFSILEGITRYHDFAEDFCSYNNIDNKFNDFFVQSVRNEFSEPYPWTEATFYYYAFSQMMLASLNSDLTRRREGVLLDFDSIREAAIDRRKLIVPETGNLDDLKIFKQHLEKLIQEYFTQDRGLDRNNEIYVDTRSRDNTYVLLEPSELIKFSRSDIFDKDNISSEINASQLERLQTESELSKCAALRVAMEAYGDGTISEEEYGELIDEYFERNCLSLPEIVKFSDCITLKSNWVSAKELYDRYNAELSQLNFRADKGIDISLEYRGELQGLINEKKAEMETLLSQYRNSGCVGFIGQINDGDSPSEDAQDAGLLE
jgi:hypothetical protein